MRLVALVCLASLALAGCSGSTDSSSSSSSSASSKVIHKTLTLGSGDFNLVPPTSSQSFPMTVKDNATMVEVRLTTTTSVQYDLAIHVDGCGDFSTSGFMAGTGGSSYGSSLCDQIEPGAHTVTVTVTAGAAQGAWTITGQGVVVKTLGNATR